MRVLIIGCGYLGTAVANLWRSPHSVTALTRSPERAAQLRAAGWQTVIGDVMQPESLKSLPEADLCLYAVGYDRHGGVDKRAVYVDGLANVLSEIASRVPRLIHISSTSVYGQDAGEMVDEHSVTHPASEGGRICLDAEQVVRDRFPGAVILRLAGLYGPGRLIGRIDQLRQGVPQSGGPDAWLNLIHVADAARVIVRLGESVLPTSAPPSNRYLVSDGTPLRRSEFYGALASLIGAPAPTFSERDAPSRNKRCDSRRLWDDLGMRPAWPDARRALPELVTMAGSAR